MNIKLFQSKLKHADFNFNSKVIQNKLGYQGLSIFPSLSFNDKYNKILNKVATDYPESTMLFGTILIQKGKVYDVKNDFFEYENKKIYVSEKFVENIKCDLYILTKNSFFTIGGFEKLVENITVHSDFIFVNPVMMEDENIYAGFSFAKNKNNKLIAMLSLCEEAEKEIDFSSVEEFKPICDEEQVFEVLKFALKEYMENSGFNKVLLGLSGGIDSAITAVLAKESIGAENVHTVMLPSMYSSKGSIEDSLELVKNTGISVEQIPITPLFDCFMNSVVIEKKDDIAEENLQSRIRGLILMFKSNRERYLLLTTGNKSEAATGYGTLYGDMCGGLNLIADLTKTNVYKLSNWINRNKEVIPKNILTKAPSAELRPGQKDQDTLPEYEILDDIIEMYFEKSLTKTEIYKKYDKTLVDEILKKIYTNEFKRRQACLGIRLTERAFCSNIKLPISSKDYLCDV